ITTYTLPLHAALPISVSGPRQADSITAQVIGDSTTLNDTPYCLFTSAQGGVSVPIPAYLEYNNQSGSVTQARNSCGEAAISLNRSEEHTSELQSRANL